MTPKIAIVGAGLAGLACAHRLAAAGAAVTVYEKSRGPGGRCATRRSEVGPFHHGAPAFTAHSAALLAELARWQAADWVRPGALPGTWVGWPTMNALARQLAVGLHVVTEATATALEHDGPGADGTHAAWCVHFAEAALAPAGGFDAVVVAAPAEQALALTRRSAPLQALLQTVHSAPCWTLMLAWPPGAAPPALPALPQGGPLAAVVDCSALPHSPHSLAAPHAPVSPAAPAADTPAPGAAGGTRWALHAHADWSRVHLEDTPAQATEALLQALSAAWPSTGPLPPPLHAVAHRWRYAQVTAPAAAPFGWDAALRLGCCGDAWQGSDAGAGLPQPGGIERAWLSAVGLADALLRDGPRRAAALPAATAP